MRFKPVPFPSLAGALLGLLLISPLLWAQETAITVSKGSLIPITVELFGGTGGAEATKVLEQDLKIQGFKPVSSGGKYSVRGTVGGEGVQGTLNGADGTSLISRTFPGSLRTAVHAFADDIVLKVTGEKGIASTRIAFVSNRTGKKEIYLADYDGANARQVTTDKTLNVGPKLSRDGTLMVYTSYRGGFFANVFLQRVNASGRKQIVAFAGTNTGAEISPDNTQVALTVGKYGNPEIAIVPIDGGADTRLTNTRGAEATPSWSPDGQKIVYTSDDRGSAQLFVVGRGGGPSERLSTGYGYNTEPNWSPRGNKVAFTTRLGGGFQIAVHDLDQKSTSVVSKSGSNESPCWAPNGRHLIFSGTAYGGKNLIILDSLTGETLQATRNLGECTEPSWSK
ncbi:MAG: hypothetical protein SFY92_05970 [Verrucomicrobiae bacterium]|nr:hypothetical protein [Verrucomicrobiae bacterium]